MEWHINDLSLEGYFSSPEIFIDVVQGILEIRKKNHLFRSNLYCSKSIHTCRITSDMSFSEIVYATKDNNFKKQVLEWLTKSGPFWEDDRQEHQEDYFEYCSRDVTDKGLGEAARRRLVNIDAHAFSFEGSSIDFKKEILEVQHGLSEQPIGFVNVKNFWNVDKIISLLEQEKIYSCWQDIYDEVLNRFDGLIFLENMMDELKPFPYSSQVSKRIFDLLDVLNTIYLESDNSGKLSQRGLDILNTHFVGDKAWFADESHTNKVKFKAEMTFSDSVNAKEKIFCPWHGRIKTPQIRIHFEWPRPEGQKKIKVVYIGPKITKK